MRMRIALSVALVTVLAAVTLGLSGPAQAGTRYRVTVSPQTTSIAAGRRATLQGIVRVAAPGQKVFLQTYINGNWRAVSSRALTSTSTYAFHPLFRGSGVVVLRVVKPATPGHARGVSPTVLVTVKA
ncbi:MAG: hypothetical protein JWQ32_3161 [Marmoricola sp.]|nr:hypothetical protein [Marmoricola sp.]